MKTVRHEICGPTTLVSLDHHVLLHSHRHTQVFNIDCAFVPEPCLVDSCVACVGNWTSIATLGDP